MIPMKQIAASKFKAECLTLLDELSADGLIITKRGKPVATVFPYREARPIDFIGALKGKTKIKGNIFSTGRKWDAQS